MINLSGKNRIALKIALIYIVIGTLWILLSDIAVGIFVDDKGSITNLNIIKGCGYVLATGLLLYYLIYSDLKKVMHVESALNQTKNEFTTIHGKLVELQDFNMLTLQKMHDAFSLHRIILDADGKPCDYEFIDINPAMEAFLGLERDQIIGRRYSDLIPKCENESTDWVSLYGEVALTGKMITVEKFTESYNKWVALNAYSPQKDYFVTIFHDITERKLYVEELKDKNEELVSAREELKQQNDELRETQKKLHHMAYYDTLTGLPNRVSLFENCQTCCKCALLSIDVDNFKYINDTMGHTFGDRLIVSIGERILSGFNNRDVYRLGGDEFIVHLEDYGSPEDVTAAADKIIGLLKEPFRIGDSLTYITVSIGVSLYPEHGKDAGELLKNSDIALYKAKESGKNRYVVFDSAMNAAVNDRMAIERNLRTALQNNELSLFYQPQVDLQTDRITGFEALIRWRSAELGSVSPDRFIGIAEDTHLIIPIGEWVLRNACSFMKGLHNNGKTDLEISVNISIVQLLQDDFVEDVLNTLRTVGLDPGRLELEITESIVIKSYEAIGAKLAQLRSHGVKIALDDFGKGFSSLNGLQNLKIDTLKIDKVFVDNILAAEEKSLVENIIRIGNKMSLTVLAEGVETKEQLDYLKMHGCHKMQGYLFSKPLPEGKAAELVSLREAI